MSKWRGLISAALVLGLIVAGYALVRRSIESPPPSSSLSVPTIRRPANLDDATRLKLIEAIDRLGNRLEQMESRLQALESAESTAPPASSSSKK
ncbi:MAG: hypothetical protein ACKVX7_14245 [Planctomycetota bacterium]